MTGKDMKADNHEENDFEEKESEESGSKDSDHEFELYLASNPLKEMRTEN